jgi:hypothetical protein
MAPCTSGLPATHAAINQATARLATAAPVHQYRLL